MNTYGFQPVEVESHRSGIVKNRTIRKHSNMISYLRGGGGRGLQKVGKCEKGDITLLFLCFSCI